MIYAGMGEAAVHFPQQVFPNPREKYTDVHDEPLVHVLIIEDRERFAFAFADLVDPGDWESVRCLLAQAAGVEYENAVLHTSHVLSTPHCAREYKNEAERENDLLLRQAIIDAVCAAAEAAAADIEPVEFGIATAYSQINVNRVLETVDGYAEGTNEAGDSDHSVPVICIKRLDGTLKGVIYTVNCAAGVLENSRLSDGRRPVSGDIASGSERKLQERLGAQAVYTIGASGDQWQILRAVTDGLDKEGRQVKTDRGALGFEFVDILSERLAQSVALAVPCAEYADVSGTMELHHRSITLPGHKPLPPPEMRKITRHMEFEPGPDVTMDYAVFRAGDTAVIGCMPEICAASLRRIREGSPFKHTILMEFVNNHANYMVTKDLYEKCAPQSRKGNFAAGAAERFEEDAIAFLNKIY